MRGGWLSIDRFTSMVTYLLALVATWVFYFVSMEVPVRLEALRYSDFWSMVYDAHHVNGGVIMLTVLGLSFYMLRRRMTVGALIGSVLYFLPTFSVFLVGMALYYTGVELVVNWVYQVMYSLGSDSMFPHRFFSSIFYVGEFFFLPYWGYVILFWSGEDWYAIWPLRDQFGPFFIALGSLVMFLGVSKWIEGKWKGLGLVQTGIYRLTRHPQYLGFILWGYGVMVYSTHRNAPFQHPIVPTLNWVLSSLMIIGVALIEEIKLREQMEYNAYAEQVSFLVPLPRYIRGKIAAPWKALWKGDYPGTVRMVGLTLFVVFVLLMLPKMVFGPIYRYELFRQYGKSINFYEIFPWLG